MGESKFQKFYQTNFDKIYRFVSLRVPNREVAEDLVSEIFFKAFKAFDRYDETISKSSWIFTIARNHLANYYRSAGRTVNEDDLENMALAGEDFFERAAKHQQVQTMLGLLSAMPAEKQRLIRMKYLEELSYEEMSERLGRERGALKVATFRAMQELRKAAKGKL